MNIRSIDASLRPQCMRALERANAVRLARAELKRKVACGEVGVAEVVLCCPWQAQNMAVADLLISLPRWGQVRCRKTLAQVPMSERKTFGSMTDRQRHALARILECAEGGAHLRLGAQAIPPLCARGD